MQAKKRAKPVKFGRKTTHSATSVTGNHHQASHHEKPHHEKEDRPEEIEEVVIETETTEVEFSDDKSEETVQPQQADSTAAAPLDSREQENEEEVATEAQDEISAAPAQEEEPVNDDESVTENTAEERESRQPEEEHLQEQNNTQDAESDAQNNEEREISPALGGDTYIVEKEVKKNMLGYFFLIAVVSFLVGLGSMAGANYFFKDSNFFANLPVLSFQFTPEPPATPTPTQTQPSPTPQAVALDAFDIEIQNGSGIRGAAAELQTSLEAAGFTVTQIGNADSSDFTQTLISAKEEVSEGYLKQLREELGKTYELAPIDELPSTSSAQADVIITIGSSTP